MTILDIESAIRSFFASLGASLQFNLMFIVALALELVIIIMIAIRVRFSYEIRTAKALDKLNRWLFVNKKITAENIKEFTNLVKKMPRRLSYNWQQFILYREKAPSEYLNVENLIEKPLKASSFASNIKNLGILSALVALLSFIVGIAHNNIGDTVLNGSMLIVALIAPFAILVMWGVATLILNARRNFNLDELYQNHHLFQRFIDNACVDLPAFIDFTLLFSVEEIEKGIPALREYLENRARKEKEEFDRAKNEMVVYEKYDFEKAGVDGSNILERAMNESEAYLNSKNKTLAKISQLEASLESLKKNFDNIQKDYQRKMQISKENIDRLRQQQEETTSRIESNFLRKQQATEIAKQEKEEADFEQQKRRYLVEKNDYEEEIKNLNAELNAGRADAEKAMLSEYQSFYKRVCQKAYQTVDKDIKEEIVKVREEKEATEDELANVQTLVKRLEDENLTLKKKFGIEIDDATSRLMPQKEEKKKKEKEEEPVVDIEEPVFEEFTEEIKNDEAPAEGNVETYAFEESPEYEAVTFDEEPQYEDVTIEKQEVSNSEDIQAEETPKKRRGRPVGSTKQKIEKAVSRGRGRPRKPEKEEKQKENKRRGRPVGSKNKVNSPSMKKRNQSATGKRGRPRKDNSTNEIENKINKEEKRMQKAQKTANKQINETLKSISKQKDSDKQREKLIKEIEKLKVEAASINENTPTETIEKLNQKMESLLKQINEIED